MSKVNGVVLIKKIITRGGYDPELGEDISVKEEKIVAIPKAKLKREQEKEELRASKIRELNPRAKVTPSMEVLGDAYEVYDNYKGGRRRLLVTKEQYDQLTGKTPEQPQDEPQEVAKRARKKENQ